jgi:CBS domain-containing protein
MHHKYLSEVYYLSEIKELKAVVGSTINAEGTVVDSKKIGKLNDIIAIETDTIPEITHFYISRSFGYPPLIIPWEKVITITNKEIAFAIDDVNQYIGEPEDYSILLKDNILDKKVIDIEGREVDVVYDIRIVYINDKLYVSDVDFSRYGFLRRVGLKKIADYIYHLAFMRDAASMAPDQLSIFGNIINNIANSIKDNRISWKYIQHLPPNLGRFKGDVTLKIMKERLAEIHPVDLADMLEMLDSKHRTLIMNELDTGHASEILEEIDPNVQRDIVSNLKKDKVVQLINKMTPAQAADILSVLPSTDAKSILNLMKKNFATKIRTILEKQEETITNYATEHVLKFMPDITVAMAFDKYQKEAKKKKVITYLYIIDEQNKLLGVIGLKEILLADENALLKDIMVSNIITLSPISTLKESSELFARYNFNAIPVIDKNNTFFGVVPYRDIMNLKHRFVE